MKPNPKILIIEDEVVLREALVDKFTRERFATFAANDGKAGLTVAKRVEPDIILLDIVMPNMDGMTMLKLLRQEPWGKDIPVILLTNLSDFTELANAMENHAFDYLVKSNWTLDAVVAKVRQRLGAK